jgi:hypothetical protein
MTAFRTWPAVLLCDPRHGVSLLTDGRAVLKMFNITIAYKGQVGLPLNIWGWLVRRYIFWLWTVAVCIYRNNWVSSATTAVANSVATYALPTPIYIWGWLVRRYIFWLWTVAVCIRNCWNVLIPHSPPSRNNWVSSSNNSSGKFSCYLCSSYPHSLTVSIPVCVYMYFCISLYLWTAQHHCAASFFCNLC